jgi:hypothetical protein
MDVFSPGETEPDSHRGQKRQARMAKKPKDWRTHAAAGS